MNVTGRDQYIGDETQRRRETFATIICVDNSIAKGVPMSGLTNLASIDQLRVLQREMESNAWHNWVPRQKFDVIQFERGEHLALDAKRMWHQFLWTTDYIDTNQVSEERSEEMERQVRDITEGIGTEHPSVISQIVVGYEPQRDIENPDTVSDYFLRVAPVTEPTQAQRDAAVAASDLVEDTNDLP
jgi:hypothetical protein